MQFDPEGMHSIFDDGFLFQSLAAEVGVNVQEENTIANTIAYPTLKCKVYGGVEVTDQAIKPLIVIKGPSAHVGAEVISRLRTVWSGKAPEPKTFHSAAAAFACQRPPNLPVFR